MSGEEDQRAKLERLTTVRRAHQSAHQTHPRIGGNNVTL